MERETYLETIKNRLAAYFDFEAPYEYQQQHFELYAKSVIRNERYFASKKIKVYAIENKEHVFVKCVDALTRHQLDTFWQVLCNAAEELPEPHEEHMSTIINGILVMDEQPDATLREQIQGNKFEKSFMFGLKGWVYVRLVAVSLKEGELIHNKRGKEVKELYSPSKPIEP